MTAEQDGDRPPTIAGVATGTADGGVAIVRLSGPIAQPIAAALITGPLPPPRQAALRTLTLGEQALVLCMPGPRSFTGEDVVELHIHAGEANVAQVLRACLQAGAHAAGPGDFTRRAFENQRLSLDQAEGIAALIGARTTAAVDQARRLVAGELGRSVELVRARVETLRLEIEANLDFPEDVAAADEARFAAVAGELEVEVRSWLARFEAGRRARERARIAIAGPPNAGKSALFNALLGRTRALVSAQAGTTRDYLEAELAITGDRELTLIDTAGLRDAGEDLERAGVELGREQIAGADVIVWVEGADQAPQGPGDTLERAGATVIPIENKADLERPQIRPGWLRVSAHTGEGLEVLRRRLRDATQLGEQWIGLARHHDRAQEAADALAEARDALSEDLGLELVAFSLGVAQHRLGEITGRSGLGPVGEEILRGIFSRFCIGK